MRQIASSCFAMAALCFARIALLGSILRQFAPHPLTNIERVQFGIRVDVVLLPLIARDCQIRLPPQVLVSRDTHFGKPASRSMQLRSAAHDSCHDSWRWH